MIANGWRIPVFILFRVWYLIVASVSFGFSLWAFFQIYFYLYDNFLHYMFPSMDRPTLMNSWVLLAILSVLYFDVDLLNTKRFRFGFYLFFVRFFDFAVFLFFWIYEFVFIFFGGLRDFKFWMPPKGSEFFINTFLLPKLPFIFFYKPTWEAHNLIYSEINYLFNKEHRRNFREQLQRLATQ